MTRALGILAVGVCIGGALGTLAMALLSAGARAADTGDVPPVSRRTLDRINSGAIPSEPSCPGCGNPPTVPNPECRLCGGAPELIPELRAGGIVPATLPPTCPACGKLAYNPSPDCPYRAIVHDDAAA